MKSEVSFYLMPDVKHTDPNQHPIYQFCNFTYRKGCIPLRWGGVVMSQLQLHSPGAAPDMWQQGLCGQDM